MNHASAKPEPSPDRPEPPRPPAGEPVVKLKHASYGPYIFNRMVDRVIGKVADGDIVAVADNRGRLFGWGFYNRRSRIALRMLTHAAERPDDAELARRVIRAVKLRCEQLGLESVTDAYRLVHAEGDGLTGLIADRFGDRVVIELFSKAILRRLELLEDAFIDAGLDVKEFVVRADKSVAQHEGFQMHELPGDNKPRRAEITEHGVKFIVDLTRGHKTGFFCDQRDNRLALTAFTPGKRVLDCCCYTGGFACYAAGPGRAAEVTGVDLDEKILPLAAENAALNGASVEFHHADAFDYLRAAEAQGRQWDVVVLDPSKFVRRRTELDLGLHKYADLNRLAARVVAPGGLLLTCSCSGLVDLPTFTHTVTRAARSAERQMQILRVSGAGADHPVMGDALEGAYLKAIWGRIL